MTQQSLSKRMFLRRARVVGILYILVALLLIARLYFVQIVDGEGYSKEAIGQYTAAYTQNSSRGSIFFTTKDGALITAAVEQTGWGVAINPQLLQNPEEAFQKISAILPVNRDTFFQSAGKKNDTYAKVASRLDDAEAAQVRALSISGVVLIPDEWRFYPGGTLAAQTLGFVGYAPDGTTKVGVYGLEKAYDTVLKRSSSNVYVNPFAEIFTSLSSVLSTDPTAREGSIITTIDPEVQAQLEKGLDQIMTEYAPQVTGGIIMNPENGAIYAMAARPTFNPNDYTAVKSDAVFKNPLISGRYELGSIMKPLTMAAGLDSGAITENTTYNDTGCILVSGFKVCNWDFKARGVIPMQQILSQSLNVGASWVATQTSYPVFAKYMKSYGLGERTGIDLPDEIAGDLSNLGDGSGPAVNFDTAAFGQGITVSPIEMVRALSALGNGGTLPWPHVVSAIQYDNGVTRTVTFPPQQRVISTTTSRTISHMLGIVYDTAESGGIYRMVHYTAAAKTGTAQIPKPGGGYYPNGIFLHSYFDYFPVRNPQFIIFLFAIRPQGVEYASHSLGPINDELEQFLINYYNLPPDR